ncbi:MAG: helix-turn-helix domain-containing protein [Lachnospiraceae bacterium]|nr:helix-turn-helix domain-containing protein [Lachnospiraceae bacterium]
MDVGVVLDRINELLAERGWTLYELANESKLPVSSLYNMMKRRSMPRVDTLFYICEAFNISMREFFTFEIMDATMQLTDSDRRLIEINHELPRRKREVLMAYAEALNIE